MSNGAFVFYIYDDIDLSGVLIAAYSLFNTNTTGDVVCMVTSDISEKSKTKMKSIGIVVIDVDYILTNAYLEERPYVQKYTPDIAKYCTKWNCLKLVQYAKILCLDINMFIMKNLDFIFKIDTPAMHMFLNIPFNARTVNAVMNAYEGESIPIDIIDKMLNEKYGAINSSCISITPDLKMYNDFLYYLKDFDIRKFNTTIRDDGLAILSFYHSLKVSIYYLGMKWACIQWQYRGMCTQYNSHMVNFIGIEKPWIIDISDYYDTKRWYESYDSFIKKYPGLLPETELKAFNYTMKNKPIQAKENEKNRIKRNEILKSGYMLSKRRESRNKNSRKAIKSKSSSKPKGKSKGKSSNKLKGKSSNKPKGKSSNKSKGKSSNKSKGKSSNKSKGKSSRPSKYYIL